MNRSYTEWERILAAKTAENLRLIKNQKPSKIQFMEILDKHLKEAGIKITVRRYNSILTDLDYTLD